MLSLVLAASLAVAGASAWQYGPQYYLNISYSTVTGYFLQDLSTTDASTFDYVRYSVLIIGSRAG